MNRIDLSDTARDRAGTTRPNRTDRRRRKLGRLAAAVLFLAVSGCRTWAPAPPSLEPLRFENDMPKFLDGLRDDRARELDHRLRSGGANISV